MDIQNENANNLAKLTSFTEQNVDVTCTTVYRF